MTAASSTRYSAGAIALHWIVFLLVAGGWALGQYMSELPLSPQKLRYISWHKWIGVTVFLLVLVRLVWRAYRTPPPLLPGLSAFERRAAPIVHALLYVSLITIPLTGWLFSSASGVPTVWLGLVQLPDLVQKDKALADALRQVHVMVNWGLATLVIGHAGYALKHHFVNKDAVLSRMLPFIRRRPPQ